jgi:hypothetical protein
MRKLPLREHSGKILLSNTITSEVSPGAKRLKCSTITTSGTKSDSLTEPPQFPVNLQEQFANSLLQEDKRRRSGEMDVLPDTKLVTLRNVSYDICKAQHSLEAVYKSNRQSVGYCEIYGTKILQGSCNATIGNVALVNDQGKSGKPWLIQLVLVAWQCTLML